MAHELLISEVYVQLTEKGNFVYWMLTEENLRREIVRSHWREKRKDGIKMLEQDSVGDFKICYYDRATGRVEFQEGEIAVKYNREQISNKKGHVSWYCYDAKEARKIKFLTGQKASILTKRILETQEKSNRETKKKVNQSDAINCWLELLGGLTIQVAAYLKNCHYLTARTKLKNNPELKEIYDRLQPGLSRGRGTKLFIRDEFVTNEVIEREILVWNYALHFLYERKWTAQIGRGLEIDDSEVKATRRKIMVTAANQNDEIYNVLIDAEYLRSEKEWLGRVEAIQEIVNTMVLQEIKTMLCVSDGGNYNYYKKRLAGCEIVNLNDYRYNYMTNCRGEKESVQRAI